MAEVVEQGVLSTGGTVIFTGTSSSVCAKVFNIRINNSSAYTITLQRYEAATSTTTTIYSVTLSAGDTLTDNLGYALSLGDQIIITSSIAGSTYYAYILTP